MSEQYDIKIELNDKQKLCKEYWEDNSTTDLGYGGGAGGGKSYLGVILTWMNRIKYPGTRGFFGREELKRLKQTTLNSYFKFLDEYNIPEELRGVYNDQSSMIKFANGSEILLLDLAWMPKDPLYQRFGSLELTDGFIDESPEVRSACIDILKTRIGRQRNDEYGLLPKLLQTFNPDKGHVYKTFYKPYKLGTLPDYRQFIPALVTDNPKISKSYIQQLERADDVTKERLLYGNFEYDATPGRLMDYKAILNIATNPRNNGKKYITADVAREGRDKTVIRVWDGFEVIRRVEIAKSKLDVVWNKIAELSQEFKIPMRQVVVDEDGLGGGVVDFLKCEGFVNNSSQIIIDKERPTNYANLKTQCTFLFAQKVNDGVIRDEKISEDAVQELDAIVQVDIDKDGKIKMISKDEIKKKLGRSPDDSDSLIMRMYFELTPVEAKPMISFI